MNCYLATNRKYKTIQNYKHIDAYKNRVKKEEMYKLDIETNQFIL